MLELLQYKATPQKEVNNIHGWLLSIIAKTRAFGFKAYTELIETHDLFKSLRDIPQKRYHDHEKQT